MRLCPQHGTHLREESRARPRDTTEIVLVCPRGHDTPRWMVWDHERSRLIGFGDAERAHVVLGVCDDVLELPRAERRTRVVRRRKAEF